MSLQNHIDQLEKLGVRVFRDQDGTWNWGALLPHDDPRTLRDYESPEGDDDGPFKTRAAALAAALFFELTGDELDPKDSWFIDRINDILE